MRLLSATLVQRGAQAAHIFAGAPQPLARVHLKGTGAGGLGSPAQQAQHTLTVEQEGRGRFAQLTTPHTGGGHPPSSALLLVEDIVFKLQVTNQQ